MTGGGFLAWIALMAVLTFGGGWGYQAIVEYHGSAGLALISVVISVVFLFVRIAASVELQDPDVRLGTFLGTLVGGIAALFLHVWLFR
jgi:hypothetical protein